MPLRRRAACRSISSYSSGSLASIFWVTSRASFSARGTGSLCLIASSIGSDGFCFAVAFESRSIRRVASSSSVDGSRRYTAVWLSDLVADDFPGSDFPGSDLTESAFATAGFPDAGLPDTGLPESIRAVGASCAADGAAACSAGASDLPSCAARLAAAALLDRPGGEAAGFPLAPGLAKRIRLRLPLT